MLPKTILIADDQPYIRRLMEFTLEEINCAIESASSGEQAVEKSSRMHTHFDYARCKAYVYGPVSLGGFSKTKFRRTITHTFLRRGVPKRACRSLGLARFFGTFQDTEI
jgi:CheY-like chemotaxis protein